MRTFIKEITVFRLALLAIIFFSGGIQVFSIEVSTLMPTILLTILYLKNKINTIHVRIKRIIFIVTIYFAYALFLANDLEDVKFVLFRVVRFLMAILLLNYIYLFKVKIINELYIVLRWLAVHGIANFILVNLFFDYFTLVPRTSSSSLLVFFGAPNYGSIFYRNQSIFWEPGVYQIYLNIFLWINLFFRKKLNKFPVWLILFLILTTLSTTGLVVAFLLVSYYFVFNEQKRSKKVAIIILAAPLIYVFFMFTKDALENKISGKGRGSYWARSFDTVNGFKLAYNNPWGIGFSTKKYQVVSQRNLFNIDTLIDTNRANTNSIAMLFYATGIFWGIIFLIYMYKQNMFNKHKLLFFIILILVLFSEPLFFTPFFLLFPLMGMSSNTTKKKIKKH